MGDANGIDHVRRSWGRPDSTCELLRVRFAGRDVRLVEMLSEAHVRAHGRAVVHRATVRRFLLGIAQRSSVC